MAKLRIQVSKRFKRELHVEFWRGDHTLIVRLDLKKQDLKAEGIDLLRGVPSNQYWIKCHDYDKILPLLAYTLKIVTPESKVYILKAIPELVSYLRRQKIALALGK